MRTTPKMGLSSWDQLSDYYNYAQLAGNWHTVDIHDHSAGRGVPIPAGGLAPGAVISPSIAAGAVTSASLAPDSVTSAAIASGAVTADSISGILTADNFTSGLAASAGVNQTGLVTKGVSNIPTLETITPTAGQWTLMTTPDQVTGISLPPNGLLRVWYQATWQESVGGAARAAIFIGTNQLQVALTNGSNTTQAAWTTSVGALGKTSLATCSMGLVSCVPQPYVGDVTTGQAVGQWITSSANVGSEFGGTLAEISMPSPMPLGGPCDIFANAGVYTVSVKFKVSSGNVSASNRRLWVEAVSFS